MGMVIVSWEKTKRVLKIVMVVVFVVMVSVMVSNHKRFVFRIVISMLCHVLDNVEVFWEVFCVIVMFCVKSLIIVVPIIGICVWELDLIVGMVNVIWMRLKKFV